MYEIKPYSFRQAAKLGLEIKPSKNKNKKIDVYKMIKKLLVSVLLAWQTILHIFKTKVRLMLMKDEDCIKHDTEETKE